MRAPKRFSMLEWRRELERVGRKECGRPPASRSGGRMKTKM